MSGDNAARRSNAGFPRDQLPLMVGFGWERLEKTLNIYRQKTVNIARFIDDRCPVNNDVFWFDENCMFILPALLFPNVNLFASKYLFNKQLLVSKTKPWFCVDFEIYLLKLCKPCKIYYRN